MAQTLSGILDQEQNIKMKLYAFVGSEVRLLDSTMTASDGAFELTYSLAEGPMVGYLQNEFQKSVFVILNGEDIRIEGTSLVNSSDLAVTEGKENKFFETYAKQHPLREQALSAWRYLNSLYASNGYFESQKKQLSAIQSEQKRISNEDREFINRLPSESYVKWYLPVRRIISDVEVIAQYRPEDISNTLSFFRELAYNDVRLYHSGLFTDAIQKHIWFIENTIIDQNKMIEEMNKSIDWMCSSSMHSDWFNELVNVLFNYLEDRSLFKSSEYLSLKLLNDQTCGLNDDLSNQLESYRKMKVGNLAVDINFAQLMSTKEVPAKLSELKSSYRLVLFAAGWCQHCKDELPQLINYYTEWKMAGLDVVLIDLDTTLNEFISFGQIFPFPCLTDLKKWTSPVVKDYSVFATPSMFLLNDKMEIVLKPRSIGHLKAWVDYNLISHSSK